jgi:translation initiation factor RLI1
MAGKIALVDFRKCDPEKCEGGICVAAQVCPQKRLDQEAPCETPMPYPGPCRGCGECVRACRLQAIKLTS